MSGDGRKRIFSGIQPTGVPTLGNYLGAMKNWADMSAEYDCLFCVVDLHAITVRQDPDSFRARTRQVFALLLACGLTPDRCLLYLQSHVPQHTELSWLLNCYTMFGELSRMTQFKDKSKKAPDNINAGLFDYPVLMAADILLYDTDLVPVGQDQKQHVELSRDIAERFNAVYGNVLTIPQPYIPKVGAKINSLLDPSRKMDKSDPNPGAFIALTDARDVILGKFKKAVTDSDPHVRFDPAGKPGVSNLMSIYALVTGKTLEDTEREFDGKGYGVFKTAVGEAVDTALSPIRARASALLGDPDALDRLMAENAEKAAEKAAPCLRRVRQAIGFIEKRGSF